jgi:DNA modification methylase
MRPDPADITLHLGDCEDVLDRLPAGSVDLVVTDPPWNLGLRYGRHDDAQPPERYEAWLARVVSRCTDLGARRLVYLPGRHHLPRTGTVLEPAGLTPTAVLRWQRAEGDWEPVVVADVVPHVRPVAPGTFHAPRPGPDEASGHPCPKPPALLAWLLRRTAWPGATVLDPFAGTGTTLVAAASLGLRAVGIEQEERFWVAATVRVAGCAA